MVLNPDKCHYMYMGKNSKSHTIFQFENNAMEHHNTKEILGILIDNQLSFEVNIHVTNLQRLMTHTVEAP